MYCVVQKKIFLPFYCSLENFVSYVLGPNYIFSVLIILFSSLSKKDVMGVLYLKIVDPR